MKFLGFLFILLSLSTHASELKKTFDGSSARCNLSADAGNSAYRLKILAERKEKGIRILNLEIGFFKMSGKCFRNGTCPGLGK